MASLYAQYILEREGKEIIEDENGFLTYCDCDNGEGIYVADLFVTKDARRKDIARSYCEQIEEIAKKREKKLIRTTVESALPGWELSLKILLCNNFNIKKRDGTFIYLEREIKDGR